jgi:hypothetical protein
MTTWSKCSRSAKKRATASSLPVSNSAAVAPSPMAAPAASSLSRVREAMITAAPSAAANFVVARPIAELPHTTRKRLFDKGDMTLVLNRVAPANVATRPSRENQAAEPGSPLWPAGPRSSTGVCSRCWSAQAAISSLRANQTPVFDLA